VCETLLTVRDVVYYAGHFDIVATHTRRCVDEAWFWFILSVVDTTTLIPVGKAITEA
jgi:hypothetical protein